VIDGEAIRQGAAALDVVLGDDAVERLEGFGRALIRWNGTYNLVSRRDEPRLVARHLLDSIALSPLVNGRVLDVGTGAGLPGLPLAIVRPDCEFVLLDRSEKRLRFVHRMTAELALANVAVVEAAAELYTPTVPFDTVVSRAVASPATLWPMLRRLLAPHGRALLQCGDPKTLKMPADAEVDCMSMTIPGLDAPHWVLVLAAPTA